jgi:mono/diheme cytochrome c family protein
MYTAGTGADMYLRARNGTIETHPTLSRGQWGVTQDDAGRIYRNHNESVLHVDLVPTPYFARNPNLLRTRGSHEALIDLNGDINTVWPSRQTPGTNRAYQRGILRGDGTLAAFTAACAPTVYRGDRLPVELHGNVFVAEPTANLVSRLVLSDDGTTLRARKAYPQAEFLTSTDERFRPVNLSNAPDGTLYVVDMYRGIIQHRAYITEYLRDQIFSRKLEQPTGFGRIYRVVHETTRRDTVPGFATASAADLVGALSHPNGWWRDTAQQLLVQQSDRTVVPALVKLAHAPGDWRTRLHALWTLDGIDAIDPASVRRALEDTSTEVRAAATRIAERWLPDADHPVHAAVARGLDAADWRVRRQLAASLGTLPPDRRENASVAMLDRNGDDPMVVDAALSGLRGSEAAVLEQLLHRDPRQTPQREAAISMMAATLIRSGQEAAIQKLFVWSAEEGRDPWQRSALLRGAEIALLGAAMPGSASRRSPVATGTDPMPCPTCPGGRGGPGGAYAFPRPQAAGAASGAGRSGRGGSVLRLNREPLALSQWVARSDDLVPRVVNVLARVTWPGKIGDAAPIPALTAAEQQRFEAGREIYQTLCQACHQPDGRGQDRLAPTLIGSVLTLAPPDIPARILLNGKEGPVGLMPPIGATLSDSQIADVLTYVRREWGQPGTPVEAATVAKVRAATASRTKPWTDAELQGLEKVLRF